MTNFSFSNHNGDKRCSMSLKQDSNKCDQLFTTVNVEVSDQIFVIFYALFIIANQMSRSDLSNIKKTIWQNYQIL